MTMLTGGVNVVGQDLFTSSATAVHTIGEQVVAPDGRAYRYVKAGGTSLVVGKLQQSEAEDTGEQNVTPTAAAIGATSITTSTTLTVTANEYQSGYVLVTVTPGVGYIYRISSHPAATAAALTLTLEDSIQVALTTTSRIDIVPSPFNNVIVFPTTATGVPVGVAIYPITNAEFGWVQTRGTACVLADTTITVGTNVSASNAVAGAVEPAVTAQPTVGYALTGIADTEYGAIFLTIS